MSHRSSRPGPLGAGLLAFLQAVASAPLCAAQLPTVPMGEFTLTAGDRVVFLGSAFIERDASHGYLETALTIRFHAAQFHNLGRSGDDVFGEARAGIDSVRDGFERLKKQILATQPTVVFLNYGANESYAGITGLESFKQGLDTLLSVLDETKARVVFITPPPHENLGPPIPDPKQHNKDLGSYSLAIAAAAKKRGDPLVNLFEILNKKLNPPSPVPLTDNGIHLTAYGYWRIAPLVEQALGLAPQRWEIEIDARNQNISARGTAISQARFSPAGIDFVALDARLPLAPAPAGSPAEGTNLGSERVVRVFGLPPGKYALRIEGEQVATASAGQWTSGQAIKSGPDFEQVEKLRGAIVAKNQLHFPGRSQSQESPQFNSAVAARETEIHELCAPVARQYELIRIDAQ